MSAINKHLKEMNEPLVVLPLYQKAVDELPPLTVLTHTTARKHTFTIYEYERHQMESLMRLNLHAESQMR
jgi:hypothetical protein